MSRRRWRRIGEPFLARLRTLFLSGLGALVPVVATVYALCLLFTWTDSFLRGVLFSFLPWHLPGLRRGFWSPGFVTRDPGGLGERWPGPPAAGDGRADRGGSRAAPGSLVNVFIPTTPNPASGSRVMVPRDEVVFVDMSVEEAMRVIVSAGMVVPAPRGDTAGPGGAEGPARRQGGGRA
ncbi:MAG: hypothetical protein QJR14_10725 [Bacillota bacterium]|nr:hypothetical protein [Bacillota bacterium]